jgi:predicted P-loop ATPase
MFVDRKSQNSPSVSRNKADKSPDKNFTIFHETEQYLTKHYLLRKNIVTGDFEIKAIEDSEFKTLNEDQLYIELQKSRINISLNKLISLLKSDFVKSYNPFIDYFTNLPHYNGSKDYIQLLADHIKVKDQKRFNIHFKKWLVRVVKCAIVDDYFNKNALILVQSRQNSGKSTFCRFLCPSKLSNYIKENLSADKDGLISLTRNFLINLDELSTLSKFDINHLKTLLSKDKINERLHYDRRNSIIPRRCSFIGSTNNNEFLTDFTGSVRWLCFEVENINFDYKLNINIDKVYSQVYHLFKAGFACDLTKEEIEENEDVNEAHQITPPEMEIIQMNYKPATKENHTAFYTASDFIKNISDKNIIVKIDHRNLGKLLNKLGFVKDCKYNGTYSIKGYYIDFI